MPAIVQAFKYGGHQSLAEPLAARLAAHPHLHLESVDVVVPVPLHPWRRLGRGFNQAERIASRLGPPVLHALARRRHTRSQTGLAAPQRLLNVEAAFRLATPLRPGQRRDRRARLRDARVLLVDDVLTTGGTLSTCARVLREAGARDVCAAVLARTPPGRGVAPGPDDIES